MAGRLSDSTRTNGHRPRHTNGQRPSLEQALVDHAAAEVVRQKRRLAQLTAAGKQIDVTTRDGRKLLRRPDRWQQDVWTFYDTVPEMKFAGRFFGNSLSRIRLYPGVVVDPDEDPVPVDEAVEDGEIGLPESVAAAALDETDRLTNSADGMSGIMRGFGENIALVGECYLLGREAIKEGPNADPVLGDEYWQVYSTSAITERDDQIMVQETPKGRPQPLPSGADPVLYRIWRRHAQWPGLADSNMAAVLDECEELVIYGRLLRSIGRSSTMAGILKLPTEIDIEQAPRAKDPGAGQLPVPDPDAAPTDGLTDLERAIMQAWVVANEVDGSPAAVAPFLLRGKAEHLKEAGFIIPVRPIDDKIIDRINLLIQRMAHGADLPVEVLTGVAEANHWTGWQIEDSTYKAHVEPTAQIPASALTAVFLRPSLQERGVSSEWLPRLAFGLDASQLVVRPNRGQDARDAFDRYSISMQALRAHVGFPESDAPTAQELVLRAALEGKTVVLPGAQAMTQAPPRPLAPGDRDDEDERPEDGGGGTPDEDEADRDDNAEQRDQQAARGLILTAASVVIPGLGEQLVSIESRLRDRLQIDAGRELQQVLRRAGNRLRSATQGNPALRRRVNGTEPELVGQVLGQERAEQLASVDELLEGAFDPLQVRWEAWVPEAEAAAIGRVVRHAETPDPISAFDSRAEESDHGAGWTALFLGLMALARSRLFAAAVAEDGEALADVAVPAGLVRDALAVAGGGQAGVRPTGPAAAAGPPGLLTGPRWRAALRQLELEPTEWEWRAGFPTRPFPPHQALSGTVFRDWQDDQLTAGGTFPSVSHYYPGDHRGCLCDAVPTFSKKG
jgi:hypothetical protein